MHRKFEEAKREEGFTLIELLVVVIIIGILAAIAIPIFLNQRERAWVRAAQSDARNAAIEVETYFNDFFEYPNAPAALDGTDTPSGSVAEGGVASDAFTSANNADGQGEIVISPNVTLNFDWADDQFCITATHELIESGGEDVAVYDSLSGGIITDPADGCSI